MAAAGAAMSIYSGIQNSRKAQAEIDARRQAAENQKNLDLEGLALDYGFAKETALDAAGRSDRAVDLRENLLSLAYNSSLGNLGIDMEAQGFQNQTAMIQGDQDIQGAYASLGAGGVRSSASVYDAVDRQAALNDRSMELAMESREQQYENALIGAYASLAENKVDLGERRYDANWSRKSFEAGGENYEKYAFAQKRVEDTWRDQQELYETAYKNAEYTFWDAAVDLHTGGASGAMTGYQLGQFIDNYGGGKTPEYTGTMARNAPAYTGTPAANLPAYNPMSNWNNLFSQNGYSSVFSTLKY
jgi:hypothetical protein